MCVRSKYEDVQEPAATPASSGNQDTGMTLTHATHPRKQKRPAIASASASYHKALQPEELPAQMKPDMISVATAQYRWLMLGMSKLFEEFHESRVYKVLFHTTQPAHLVTIVAVAIVAATLFPRQDSNPEQPGKQRNYLPLMNFIYLSSFVIHFGSQVWMTFVSGLSLYFALPRHTFGGVQIVLFPKYFSMNSFLSLVTLIVFVKLHPMVTWNYVMVVQVCAMVVCFLLELVIWLYLAPPMLKLIAAKNAIELAAGVGLEVGQHSVGPLAMCPHYLGLHRAFRTIHMTVAIGNICAMACTTLHLWYLANKIC